MDIELMRIRLRDYYGPGSPFAAKLKYMKDTQIQAIYLRLKNKGVLK